jgi:hypothetical protein
MVNPFVALWEKFDDRAVLFDPDIPYGFGLIEHPAPPRSGWNGGFCKRRGLKG